MSKRAFGIRDPLQDARRVRTAQILSESAANSNLPAGFALENKIYLWPGDGGPISTFDADAAGLVAALAAAASGDTVWLPSIPISLTAAITIPLGVSVIGLSHDGSILSFTTLSNESAITHSASSTLEHLTVIVAGTQPLIGVDARAAKAAVRHVAVYMADHANNIKIYGGWPESP